jgi:MEMO1 family protein
MVRKPMYAGSFYASNFNELEIQIKDCFLKGPGLPKRLENLKPIVKGSICPHAGFMYSGKAAAYIYKEIFESENVDTFILIGPNHTGLGYNSILLESFETPFGIVNIDFEFSKALIKEANLSENSLSHLKEHSLEVQLPFLQFISKKIKVVALVVSDCDYKKIGLAIKNIAKEQNKKVTVIASSDFIHHGFNYGFVKFKDNISKNVKEFDLNVFNFIKNNDAKGFVDYVNKESLSICGVYPIAIMLNSIDFSNVEILSHYTSTDISGDEQFCVDYIAAVFR